MVDQLAIDQLRGRALEAEAQLASSRAINQGLSEANIILRRCVATDLRDLGYSVAVHNDYRQNGEARTFWLLTHYNGTWVKGEGASDGEALAQIRDKITRLKVDD